MQDNDPKDAHAYLEVQGVNRWVLASSADINPIKESVGENLPRWFTIPKNRRSSVVLEGVVICKTAAILPRLAENPFWSMEMLVCENKHLSALRVTPAAWTDLSAAARRASCSPWSRLKMKR